MAIGFDLIDEGQLTAIVTSAVGRAAKKAQNDLLVAARRNVQKYYDQYDPDVYIRTYNLRDNVDHIPILHNSSSGNSISFEVGFQYDGSKIGAYPDGGDPTIVFENFLEGIHPRRLSVPDYLQTKDDNGNRSKGVKGESQNKLMEQYVNIYLQQKIDGYMQSELIAAFSKLM